MGDKIREVTKIIEIIRSNISFDSDVKSIFNVQIYGNHANVGGVIAIIENDSISIVNDNEKTIFKILREIEPYLCKLQMNQGNNHNGNIYIKLNATSKNDFNMNYYVDNENKLEIENYLLWEFDELNYIKNPNSKLTIETLKKFNRIK